LGATLWRIEGLLSQKLPSAPKHRVRDDPLEEENEASEPEEPMFPGSPGSFPSAAGAGITEGVWAIAAAGMGIRAAQIVSVPGRLIHISWLFLTLLSVMTYTSSSINISMINMYSVTPNVLTTVEQVVGVLDETVC
jgi:hypothetical protein